MKSNRFAFVAASFLGILLSFNLAFGATYEAQDSCSLPNGTSVFMYYRANPRVDIGPMYTCNEVARLRTCMNGALSEDIPECSDLDSGACHAGWLEQLSDVEFKFPTCID